jgi:hypothetical protein
VIKKDMRITMKQFTNNPMTKPSIIIAKHSHAKLAFLPIRSDG